MGLLFKNAVEKADTIITKYEGKRKELQEKFAKLNDEARFLQSEVENDFQRAILEDGKPNDKLKTDLNKVCEECRQVQNLLGNMDNLLQKALEDIREEVEVDRDKIFKREMQKQEDEVAKVREAKLVYLKALVEYSNMKGDVDSELHKFREIENRLGMKPIQDHRRRVFEVRVNRYFDKTFHPIITTEESIGASNGRLDSYAKQYDEQKK